MFLYDFYSELMRRHVDIYGKYIILLIQNEEMYEILSNMNDMVDLTEISLSTSLRISKIDPDRNIHSIKIPSSILQKVLLTFLQNNYISVVINSRNHMNSTHLDDCRFYEIHFPEQNDIKDCP